MFTFMQLLPAHGCGSLTVSLDISPSDVVADTAVTKQMVADAKKAKRKFGNVTRAFTGTTLFTYDPANQAQIEMQLLALLCEARIEVNASTTGEATSWGQY